MVFGLSTTADRAKLNAIDLISANIMIADAGLTITYLNAATKTLLQEAESDLKKELPGFNASTLVGSKIDIFLKNPSHQQTMLATLKSQHRATITIGQRAFDLRMTPLKSGDKVTGFVVEWSDAKAKRATLDYQYQMEALSRVQAIIAFTPDGQILTANQNFCDALGYRLEEIAGKHHSMFVEQAYAASPDYERFWSDLRSGKFQAAEFVRYGKAGKRVVINASYNPIFDEHGNVIKVVKYAMDVTKRVEAVETIGEALQKMAGGDLSFQVDKAFAADFEPLRENLNGALGELASALAAVTRSTDLIDNGAREISRSAEDLSRRTEQQAASLEETAAALDEITVNVKNASQRTDDARTATENAEQSAKHSGNIVAQAVGAMARIEQSSSQISNIIGVIDEIAFQTNLLALNAGVEAARAGEAGKGFAVVAQEVRELAQRSAQAAKEIKELIRKSSDEVKGGVKLVSETGIALEAIQSNIVVVNEHMQAIASSAKEQSTGLTEVNTAVNRMDQSTQQNAAMVEESNAASATLAQEAQNLRDLVNRFVIRKTADAPRTLRDMHRAMAEPHAPVKMAKRAAAGGSNAGHSWEEF